MSQFTLGGGAGGPGGNFTPIAEFQRLAQYTQGGFAHFDRQLRRLKTRCYTVEADWRVRSEGRTPRMPIVFRSQFGEDVTIFELLDGQTQGLYIEVGAFDGVSFSVTHAFDAMGWDGLLVEAIPERFEQCRKARPHAKVEHAALGRPGHPATATFTVTDDHWGGMLSYATTNESHKQALQGMPTRQVQVPMTTMNTLLEKHFAGRTVDAAVIDVEGAEIEVLGGFDLERWKPRVLLLEDNDPQRNPQLGEYMSKQAYMQVGWLEVNRIYVRKDDTEMLRRLGVSA